MTMTEFADTYFPNDRDGCADFCAYLRKSDCCPLDLSKATLLASLKSWSKSRRRGKFCGDIDRNRRRSLGPGKYWAASSAGVYLNKTYVKGWRGINPVNP